MIKKIIKHVEVVTLCIIFADGIILIEIEGDDIFK